MRTNEIEYGRITFRTNGRLLLDRKHGSASEDCDKWEKRCYSLGQTQVRNTSDLKEWGAANAKERNSARMEGNSFYLIYQVGSSRIESNKAKKQKVGLLGNGWG